MWPIDGLVHWANLVPEQAIVAAALSFQLPAPPADAPQMEAWSTNYVLHLAHEVPAGQGHALLDPDDQPFPRDNPIHLGERDWCQSALQGSARIERLDGSFHTVNYAASNEIAVRCGGVLGHRRWDSQGRVRFGDAVGEWGDGVRGLHLVPYRSLATDPNVIPTGSLIYVPSARGIAFEIGGESYTHDGWFFAADVGGAIRGRHIDTFTGTSRQTDLPQVTNTPDETVPIHVVADPTLSRVLRGLHR